MEPALYPGDAPFVAGTVPTGWSRPITQEEADAANLLYPVPPFGPTYWPPGGPPAGANARFVVLRDPVVAGPVNNQVRLTARVQDMDVLTQGTIFTFWPIAGVLGIVDDVGVRPARILSVDLPNNQIVLNYDIQGLDVSGLVLVGVVYTGPQS